MALVRRVSRVSCDASAMSGPAFSDAEANAVDDLTARPSTSAPSPADAEIEAETASTVIGGIEPE